MSETMRRGFDWLVESSDDEEEEAKFQQHLAQVEAEEVKPPPAVTKQYLDASRRQTLPSSSTDGLGVADSSSSFCTPDLSAASTTADVDMSKRAHRGAKFPGKSDEFLPPPRTKRRWQRADNQLQGYFTSLMASEQLAEPSVRVRRNISSREERYRERIRRTAKATSTAVSTKVSRNAALDVVTGVAAATTGGSMAFDQSAYQMPSRMLAFENVTRRVQRTMQDAKSLEKQRLAQEQAAASNQKQTDDSFEVGTTPVKGPIKSTESLLLIRTVDKDPTVIGMPRFRNRQSGCASESASTSSNGARRRRKPGSSDQVQATRSGDSHIGSNRNLQSYSPLKYKETGAAHKQRELPPI